MHCTCQCNQYFLDIFKGHQVDFKDGDTSNFSLDLELMSDARNKTFLGYLKICLKSSTCVIKGVQSLVTFLGVREDKVSQLGNARASYCRL